MVIHSDQTVLDEVSSMKSYIMEVSVPQTCMYLHTGIVLTHITHPLELQKLVPVMQILHLSVKFIQELNVKSVSVSMDKNKYGVKVKAEPDFRVLGAKLGAGLKQVMAACKSLTSQQLAVSTLPALQRTILLFVMYMYHVVI